MDALQRPATPIGHSDGPPVNFKGAIVAQWQNVPLSVPEITFEVSTGPFALVSILQYRGGSPLCRKMIPMRRFVRASTDYFAGGMPEKRKKHKWTKARRYFFSF